MTVSLAANVTCGENEQFYECGACDIPCGQDVVACPAICLPGCGCLPGYKRNNNGICIPQDQCPKPTCPTNETFYSCGTCDGTCDRPIVPCPRICKLNGSCNCKEGYVRNAAGNCIAQEDCPQECQAVTKAPEDPECGFNEQFYGCGPCDSTCDQDIACAAVCRPPGGCGCLPGYKRNAIGVCIPADKCPNKNCGKNEIFVPCGPCDGTCKNLNPSCLEICRLEGGCGCKSGYVRNSKNECVSLKQCKQ
ncbi:hypothetical protein L596_013715 [Steinernema carpocapsae]|uniref:EGF-like domain-containing protein n=1 Tax=Steinernema carpocapsae TaxID=34508 RepID=A0A4U5P108_STECR|nr:hypothetical protein L596_013715 [Steinernema carpocapsae]